MHQQGGGAEKVTEGLMIHPKTFFAANNIRVLYISFPQWADKAFAW